MNSEKELREAIKKAAGKMGWQFFRIEPQNNLYGMTGLPDLLLLISNLWVVVELKVVDELRDRYHLTRKILRPSQIKFHSSIATDYSFIILFTKKEKKYYLLPSRFTKPDFSGYLDNPNQKKYFSHSSMNSLITSLQAEIDMKKLSPCKEYARDVARWQW